MKYCSFLSSSILVLFLVLSSCSKSNNNNSNPGTANLMVVNLIVGSPGVDIAVNGKKINDAPLAFTKNTPYQATVSGSRTITIYQANSSNIILSKDVDFGKDKNYSLFLYDAPNSTKSAFVEDEMIAADPGKSYIRFFNFMSSSPPATAGTVTDAGFTPIFVSRSYETETTAQANDGYTAINAGTYGLFSVRSTASIYSTAAAKYDAGKAYTLVYFTFFTGPPVNGALVTYVNR